MRTFVQIREYLFTHKGLDIKINELKSKVDEHGEQISVIIDAINKLIQPPKDQNDKSVFM